MSKSFSRKALSLPPFLLLSILLMAFWSCSQNVRQAPSQTDSKITINKVVVMGFRAAMTKGSGPNLVENPITGSSVLAEPVPASAIKQMNDMLASMLPNTRNWALVSPGQARGVMESLLASDQKMEQDPRAMIAGVGKAFDADAVLVGTIYRWQDRVGSDFAVDSPASVAFDLLLVRTATGGIFWRRQFDKTQKSLFADLFDFDTYVKSSGRWLTAEKLAEIGLKQMINKMPGKPKIQKEEKEPKNSADHPGN